MSWKWHVEHHDHKEVCTSLAIQYVASHVGWFEDCFCAFHTFIVTLVSMTLWDLIRIKIRNITMWMQA